VAARAWINKRYEQKRIAEIRRELGYDTVHVWDLTAPAKGASPPRFTISEATARIIDAAAPLGAGYVRELRALLDPANGRLDLVARPNRVDRPGFSTGSVGYPSMFFQGRFEGYVEDVVILAHEAGHAVQNMLMDSAKVLPRYAGGPSYFTESFALLSELLFLEHQTKSASTAQARHFFARHLLEDGLDLFRNGLESLVEQEIYDSTAAGRTLDAAALEALMQKRGEGFSLWFGPAGERRFAWVQPLQLYTRPLYRVNYVIGKLLALRYLELYHDSPAEFTRRYGALLRNGYDAPPQELLRRFLGVDMSDTDALVASATKVLERWVAEYEVR
jgi:oligoendopeptidase F